MAAAAAACEVPARPDSWLPSDDPEAAPRSGDASPLLTDREARARVRRDRGDTLRIHLDRMPEHLNPMVAPSVWTMRIAHGPIFETLIRHAPPAQGAGPGRYLPGLARSWEIAPGGRTIEIELRDGVKFHDGRRFTAVDAQFSLDSARRGRDSVAHLRRHLRDVSAVELAGPHALRIRLRRESAHALRALAQVPMLPRHVYRGHLAPERADVVGTGPYRLASRGEGGVRLERHAGYWGERPAIRSVAFVLEPDAAQALTAVRAGALDLVPSVIPRHYPDQIEVPGARSGLATVELRPPSVSMLALNGARAPLTDLRVRRAMALAIDRGAIAREAHGGLARPAPGPVWPGGPVDGPPAPPFPHDPAAAAGLLDAAGWTDDDGDGVRERGGRRLRVSLLATGTTSAVRSRVIEDLRAVGIEVHRRVGSRAVLKLRLRQRDFDLALVDWRGEVARDPAALLARFGGPRVGRAIDRLRRAWSPGARWASAGALAEAFAAEIPAVPLTIPDPHGLVSRRVRGVRVWNGWIALRQLRLEDE